MKRLTNLIPFILVALCLFWLAGKAVPPRDDDGAAQIRAFGELPVVFQGRVKPFDTLARNSLVIISDRQYWKDADGTRQPAIEWLLDVMSGSPRAREHKVFRIHNLDLLTQLGLERRKGFRYALAEFEDRWPQVEMQVAQASELDPAERGVYDVKALELYQKILRYRLLVETHWIPGLGADPHGELNAAMRQAANLERFSIPHAVPPHVEGEDWKPLLRAVLDGARSPEPNPALRPLAGMLIAWGNDDVEGFNTQLAAYEVYLGAHPLPGDPALAFEAAFNHFAPFYHCSVLYVLAFLLACFAWLGWADVLRRCAFWLLVGTFVVHTLAIVARIHISGYPPITNLYGTAVFIGWGCVLLGLLLERIHSIGIGNILSAVVGFLTLLIAHFLAGDGDTLEMMQAVLDTKFWLATHVIIINFGYAATFLAGGLAVLYVLRGVLTKTLDADTEKVFGRMMYGILCFGLLLSFVGTVLGGLWADDSWGRFWGWDPKENGALMIVLWTALILHARWGGMVRTRGIANLSIFGGIITAWSWFGVNQLGVGLHSYGFTESVTFWLLIFVGSQLAVMALGMMPRRLWRSGDTSRRAQRKVEKSDDAPAALGGQASA
ncbi:MAG: cytochrome c biogenesis protein [Planctomycetota bacterium]|jgi:ABC-type transport system involved in cytochrome c biogenesis permease subunit